MEFINESREKKEKFKNYVILGIGEGGGESADAYERPITQYNSVRRKIEQGATYISIDKLLFRPNKNKKKNLKEEWALFANYVEIKKDFQRNNPNMERYFIKGDMSSLPLPDESVNEIWIENVLSLVKKGRRIILNELLRVLKNDGKIYLSEYYTPSELNKFLLRYKNKLENDKNVRVNIFSGKNMFVKMIELGLSREDIISIFSVANLSCSLGFTKMEDVFLMEIVKNK